MHYAEKNDTLAFLDVIPFENSEYKLATDKLKERLAMLHARKDRHSSRENDKNVGVLAKLLEMPVDIFCEISTYLEPYDLLNLARSTRTLNGFLMSRESRPIWRMARTYYPGLPECPSDLSEPAYARLLFETDCCHNHEIPDPTLHYVLAFAISVVQPPPLLNHRPLSQEEFYIERAKAVTAKFYARYPEMKKKMITS
ncbi:hypothetical protein Clacol_010609 [Clathrus columnatus]|uniref:F-box domain-containing protein n=1 Tax=Clathrus columnatus TaxID=1419009 RepID=A0AAV5AR47_9AGAM|nr:hypothetical protein Clacol_010609 [Clathrus columnatus]